MHLYPAAILAILVVLAAPLAPLQQMAFIVRVKLATPPILPAPTVLVTPVLLTASSSADAWGGLMDVIAVQPPAVLSNPNPLQSLHLHLHPQLPWPVPRAIPLTSPSLHPLAGVLFRYFDRDPQRDVKRVDGHLPFWVDYRILPHTDTARLAGSQLS
jgi:hypothetical protein